MENATTHLQPDKYCGQQFHDFNTTFKHYHGYISVAVCVFGIVANILNIVILTRKNMISSINSLLTGLAVADTLVMLDYLPYTINHYILIERTNKINYFTYPRMLLILICDHVLVLTHTMSIAFTLTLAAWRYIAVNYPFKANQWCNARRTRVAIVACYFVPFIVCSPVFVSFSVQPRDNSTFYEVGLTEIALSNEQLVARIMFWWISVLIKLVPCVALCFFSLFLVRGLRRAGKMKSRLVHDHRGSLREGKMVLDRTTGMLVGVLVLFVVTEFPVGVLALMTAVLGEEFYSTCYLYLREARTILMLVNSALNFVIYCAMSRRFREAFVEVFWFGVRGKKAAGQEFVTEVTTSM